MKKSIVASTLLFIFLLTGCDKSQVASTLASKASEKNVEDLIFVSQKSIDYGYYKSTIVNIGESKQVWLHIPEASKDSKVDLERMSDLLVEISCKFRKIRFLKITDTNGQTIQESSDEKWDSPSPVTTLYKIILKVCEESK